VYDVTLVDVVKRRDELSDEGPGDRVGEATVLLALDVGEQLAALGVLGHQAIQRRRLSITQTARMKYAIFVTTIYTMSDLYLTNEQLYTDADVGGKYREFFLSKT